VNKNFLPQDVIDQWPEVFSEIEIQAVPIPYLHSMNILFVDGNVWEINISRYRRRKILNIEEHIKDLLDTYDDVIQRVDFKIDAARIKKDILKKTKTFVKKTKK
jgi:prepilin-type processing-associated H-X9-DG protein